MIGVIGSFGSGKSSFLQSIICEMKKKTGTVQV
jgi:ABC-type transporter Mla maintaining outer membrane lipid asymmetry ATPase subunit MlaF